ncbi:MAG TPA: LamG domain-containing protein [Thermoanaerobaculia bacterium]|nr:LamG domain-containing protein [Thermoanaerobaculia bacterium]
MPALPARSCSRKGFARIPISPLGCLLALLLLFALPAGLAAQPFGQFLGVTGSTGRVTIPDSPALNPPSTITIEAWVFLNAYISGDEEDLLGKGWTHSWALFVGSTGTLRSYTRGCPSGCTSTSFLDAGFVPLHEWTHVAVVDDGAHRLHYINGELVGTQAQPGGLLPVSPQPVELGSDPDYHGRSLNGFLDEVRLWNTARTQAQIRSTLQGFGSASTAGLVAFWPLNGNEVDIFAGHNGSLTGSPLPAFPLPPPPLLSCSPGPGILCLGGRFIVKAKFRTGPETNPESNATPVACSNPDSGLFWFFGPDNWEVMVKTIDACALNNRFWLFTAATTNVFYRLEVYDVRSTISRIYFNYLGPPAPAVTDTGAFATCP